MPAEERKKYEHKPPADKAALALDIIKTNRMLYFPKLRAELVVKLNVPERTAERFIFAAEDKGFYDRKAAAGPPKVI